MEHLFGTDGIRGIAGKFPLDQNTIKIAAHSLSVRMTAKLGRAPRLVFGRDTRESGAWIEHAFFSGAGVAGAECRSAGVITTPGVAFLTRDFEFDAGIVISASHNPFRDNGIKIFAPSGKKIEESAERLIEQDIHEWKGEPPPDLAEPIDTSQADGYRNAYLDYLARQFPLLSLNGKKIVIDCANGAASDLAPTLFSRLGAEVAAINHLPDGRNINENCGSLHLDGLQISVIDERADLGIAFDGDADRSLFVDEKGALVDGDGTLWILGRFFDEQNKLAKRKVIATVMSNIGLEKSFRTRNIDLVRTSVGDKYVLEELLRSETSLGGEQSGHIIIPEKSLVGDGMMTALFVLETMYESSAPLSIMAEGFKRFPQVLVNVEVDEKKPFEAVPEIATASAAIENELGDKGRLLLRYSGTENLARVMIEGEDQSVIVEQANRLAGIIRSQLTQPK